MNEVKNLHDDLMDYIGGNTDCNLTIADEVRIKEIIREHHPDSIAIVEGYKKKRLGELITYFQDRIDGGPIEYNRTTYYLKLLKSILRTWE